MFKIHVQNKISNQKQKTNPAPGVAAVYSDDDTIPYSSGMFWNVTKKQILSKKVQNNKKEEDQK